MIKMIKFAICDDELFATKEISEYISIFMKEKQNTSYSINSFQSSLSLLQAQCDFDVIFLDIQMEQLNGMETAKILRQRKNHSILIFITVLKEYVFDAFEVQAYDYLVKPIDYLHFKKTMNRVMLTLEQNASKCIVIQHGNSCEVIPLSKIMYCEVQGRKIYIHQDDGRVINLYDKMNNFERHVDGRFFKCHRSYLVNLDHVRGSHSGQIILSNENAIPISRLREREFAESLLRHMKEKDY